MTVNTTQVDLFAARLAAAAVVIDAVEQEWQQQWSQQIADLMRARAPRDTGTLAASIQTTPDGVIVGVDYGGFVEYGTSDTAPQPFMRPSVDQVRPLAERDAVRRAVEAI